MSESGENAWWILISIPRTVTAKQDGQLCIFVLALLPSNYSTQRSEIFCCMGLLIDSLSIKSQVSPNPNIILLFCLVSNFSRAEDWRTKRRDVLLNSFRMKPSLYNVKICRSVLRCFLISWLRYKYF